jgi:hypothetical protein
MDKRLDLGTFDGITGAIEHLLEEVQATGEPAEGAMERVKMSIMCIEQARETLADKAKHQGVLDAISLRPIEGTPKRAATGSPFSLVSRHRE